MREHPRNDRVVRSLAWRERIRVIWVKRKIVAAILKRKAPALRHDASAEAHVVGIYQLVTIGRSF